MCNRARNKGEPETLFARFDLAWSAERPMDNRFNPVELAPRGRAYVIREDGRGRGLDVMRWDVLGGEAEIPMTNVRQLHKPQWRRLASDPARRCLVPLTEFCEWADRRYDLGDGKKPLKGEMWFGCTDQPIFAAAGFWQRTAVGDSFAIMTCDANALVEPVHKKAMITILEPADYQRWLHGSYDDVVALQKQLYPAERMTMRGPVFPTRVADPGAAT